MARAGRSPVMKSSNVKLSMVHGIKDRSLPSDGTVIG